MIEFTRLNGHPLLVNPELIKFAEAAPDTLLTLVTGEKIVVRESCGEVADKMHTWRTGLLRDCGAAACIAGLDAAAATAAAHARNARQTHTSNS